ncbi:MAG TPA: hypothetical protein VIF14_11295 [Alphaproteobacteria bacterium]|jgi:hypothetical protein
MSEAGKSQEPSMEEILASIRRIIAEDEAGRSRSAPAPMPARSPDGPSRSPRPRAGFEAPAAPAARAPQGDAGELVLDLTNMVAADGSVVTIAPGGRAAPPPSQPQGFAPAPEQQTAAYGGFSRRAPPPGPGAEPRTPSYTPPPAPQPQPQPQPFSFVSTDGPSRTPRAPEAQMSSMPPIPPTLSEDSPSRRVFKRRHTAGSAFAELAQTGFAPQPQEPNGNFGKVPVGSVATELDMDPQQPPPMPQPAAFESRASFDASAPPPGFAAPGHYPTAAFAPPAPMQAPMPAPMTPAFAPAPPDDHMRAAITATAEPVIRSWLEANLAGLIEQQLTTLVQQRVDQSVATTLPQAVDQRIHQNVETNLGPYIEDRVGAHVDARLAAAVEEKVTAALKQQIASAVNQQIAQAVSQQVTSAISQQLQGQTQNVSRLVDERVKSEIRSLFQRLAGN